MLFARLLSGYGRDASLNSSERKAPGTVAAAQLPGSPIAGSRCCSEGARALRARDRRCSLEGAGALRVQQLEGQLRSLLWWGDCGVARLQAQACSPLNRKVACAAQQLL